MKIFVRFIKIWRLEEKGKKLFIFILLFASYQAAIGVGAAFATTVDEHEGLAASVSSSPAPSETMTVVGNLVSSSNGETYSGLLDLGVSIYSAPTGGTAAWSECWSSLNVSSGNISLALGSKTSFTGGLGQFLQNNPNIYIEFQVCDSGSACGGSSSSSKCDSPLTPRMAIGSVPSAGNANTLQGMAPTSFIQADKTVNQANMDLLTSGADASVLHNHDLSYVKKSDLGSLSSITLASGGILTLGADPALPMQACTKEYVDNKVSSLVTGVSSFNGRTGAVVLAKNDITALLGTLPLESGGTGATSAAVARTNLGLGTAATLDVGTGTNNVVQLNTHGKIPAALIDVSQLAGVSGTDSTKLPLAGGALSGALNLANGNSIAAGSNSAAPLKFATGTNLTTPQTGAIEFDGSNLYFTNSTPAREKIVALDANATLITGYYLQWDGGKWIMGSGGGGVTGVNTGTGLTGGPISGTVTISLKDTSVTPGQYTRANITVDQQGRLTSAANGSAVNLGSEVTGALPVANGGTGTTTLGSTGNQILMSNSAKDGITSVGTGNLGQVMIQTSGGPTFSSIDLSNSATIGNTLPVANGGTGSSSVSANYIFAGPSGSSGAPTFRQLIGDDIPNLNWGKITSGKPTTLDGYGITDAVHSYNGNVGIGTTTPEQALDVVGSLKLENGANSAVFTVPGSSGALTYILPTSAGSNNQVLSTNGSGTLSWVSVLNSGASLNASNLSGTVPSANLGSGTASNTTYLRGDQTWQTLNSSAVTESGNLYFTNARGIASTLTAYGSTTGSISSADSILTAFEKLDGTRATKGANSDITSLSGLTTALSVAQGGTGVTSLGNFQTLTTNSSGALNPVSTGVANGVLAQAAIGGAPSFALVTNANLDPAAAIARSKVAAGTASQVLINDGSGLLSSEAQLAVSRGGTGATTLTAHGVVVGEGGSALTAVVGGAGTVLAGSAGADPVFTVTPVYGVNATTAGTLGLANAGTGGATVTIQNPSATAPYNFNLPATAGNTGYVLASSGGGTSAMTWTSLSSSATTDTTNATNITSGTLGATRLPAFSGDTTTSSGSSVTITSKVNGVAYPTSPSTNTVPVVTGSNAITYEAVPNAALANSSVTIGSTAVSLGNTASTIVGLTLTSPTLTTPALGVATATSVNGLSLTSNSTGFSVAGGTTSKTLTMSNTLTFAGTDSTTMTFPTTSKTIMANDLSNASATAYGALIMNSSGTAATSIVPSTSGNYLRSNGTSWASSAIQQADLPSGSLSGAGTANYIPMYSGSNTLTNSTLYQTVGNVGVGTTAPGAKLDVVGSINIPTTTGATNGVISMGGSRFIHNFDPTGNSGTNTFVGIDSGNFTMTNGGSYNSAIGYGTLMNNTTGHGNTANGSMALYYNTSGSDNTANGNMALYINTTGYGNTAVGYQSGYNSSASLQNMSYSTFLGNSTNSSTDNITNSTAIGNAAQVTASNQMVFGNADVTTNIFHGNLNISGGGILHIAGSTTPAFATQGAYIGWNALQTGGGIGETDFINNPGTGVGGFAFMLGSNDGNTRTTAVFINGTGNVGIGSTSPGQALDVVGNIRTSECLYYSGGTTGTCSSDARLKDNIKPFTLGLKKTIGIDPVFFKYNGLGGLQNDGKEQLGVIAQEVEKVAPELIDIKNVKLHPGDTHTTEIKGVNYGAFTYMLINSVKELYIQLTGHDQDIASMKAASAAKDKEIADLRAENENIKARLEKLEKILK